MRRTPPNALRQLRSPAAPLLRRSYPGIKQDDPSLHPTGANSEAAKSLGPLANSQPPSSSKVGGQSKESSEGGTESNAVVKEQQQRQEQQQKSGQSNGQQQRSISTSTTQTRRTIAEQDEELRRRMSGFAGDGGEAGVEYENGQPVAMKRGVRNNMFRYI